MDLYEELAKEQLAEYDRNYAKLREIYPRLAEGVLRKSSGYTKCKTLERYYIQRLPWPVPKKDQTWLLVNAAKRYCSWTLLTREEKLMLIRIIYSASPGDRIMAEEIVYALWTKNQIRKSNKLKTENHGKTIQEKGSNPEGDNVYIRDSQRLDSHEDL